MMINFMAFIRDPAVKLAPNKSKAMKVYQQQLKKLIHQENGKDKADIIESLSLNISELNFAKNTEVRNQLMHLMLFLQS